MLLETRPRIFVEVFWKPSFSVIQLAMKNIAQSCMALSTVHYLIRMPGCAPLSGESR